MKVLIFNTLYYPNIVGGAEKSVQLLAEGLVKEGLKISVVTTSNKDYIDIINGVKVYYVKMPNLYWAYNSKEEKKFKKPIWHLIDAYNPFNKKLSNIIDKGKPDIIHTNNLAGFSVSVWRLAKDKNVKIVHTIRDYYLLCPKSTMFNKTKLENCKTQCLMCKLYSTSKKILSKYIDGVVGVSKFILNKHLDLGYFKNAKIKTTIYNPIKVPQIEVENIKNKKEIILGFVGRIEESKGIKFLLEKISKLNLNGVKLFIYGRGTTPQYEEALKRKYESKNIVFKGFKKTEEIYTEIDITVIPSLWHEPFPRTLIESYSYGIPVLASKRGGIPENVIEGKTGYLFDPENPEDFSIKLKKVINDFKSSKFDSNFIRNYAVENFSVKKIVEKYIELYNKTINI